MSKKFIFCITFLLSMSFYAQAQFSGSGTGTEEDPYQITNASQLDEMHNYLGTANGGMHFQLMNDIDLADFIAQQSPTTGWNPIGTNDDSAFFGFLDGGNFTVSNLWINRPDTDYIGLFGAIEGGGIQNLIIETDETHGIGGNNYVGVLAGTIDAGSVNHITTQADIMAAGGYVGGLAGQTGIPVSDCASSGPINVAGDNTGGLIGQALASVSNSSSSANVTNTGDIFVGNFMGGLVGTAQSTVTNCSASGTIIGTNGVGGLVGNAFALISDSHATGAITANKYVGGLVGESDAVTNCYATGQVLCDQDYAGGLVGQAYAPIDRCYATGSVTGAKEVGGLIGSTSLPVSLSYASGAVTQFVPENLPEGGSIDVGGLIGTAGGTVTNCYATGDVTAVLNSQYIGGLIGFSTDVVSYCYASGSVMTMSYDLVGGLIGDAWANVENCTAANPAITTSPDGNLTKVHRVVGLFEFDGTITNSYALASMRLNGVMVTTGTENDPDGLNKTAAELQSQIIYDENLTWDFDGVWTIREGQGYPYFGYKEYLTDIISAAVNDETMGTISPIGDIAVEEGSSRSFVITPNEGYEVMAVIVDGEDLGVQAEYAFDNVVANHTITVTFAEIGLGIEDPALTAIAAYPNPVSDVLTISNDQNISGVAVYNLYGQELMANATDSNIVQVNMSALASGIYFVKAESNGKAKTIKVIRK